MRAVEAQRPSGQSRGVTTPATMVRINSSREARRPAMLVAEAATSEAPMPWSFPRAAPTLGDAEVHVWRAPVDRERAMALTHVLTDAERASVGRFHFESDRSSSTVTRGALRTLCGRYLDKAPGAVSFEVAARGKPSIAGTSGSLALHFNVSHSGALALLAFTRADELGVDVEQKRALDDLTAIAEGVFSERELAFVRGLTNPDDAHEAFFRCWTRKEAFIKATGEGLACPLQGFDVTLAAGEPARLLHVDGRDASRWSMHDVPIDAGYAAALVVARQGLIVRFFSCAF